MRKAQEEVVRESQTTYPQYRSLKRGKVLHATTTRRSPEEGNTSVRCNEFSLDSANAGSDTDTVPREPKKGTGRGSVREEVGEKKVTRHQRKACLIGEPLSLFVVTPMNDRGRHRASRR